MFNAVGGNVGIVSSNPEHDENEIWYKLLDGNLTFAHGGGGADYDDAGGENALSLIHI